MSGTTQEGTDSSVDSVQGTADPPTPSTGGVMNPTTGAAQSVTALIDAIEQQSLTDPTTESVQRTTEPSAGITNGIINSTSLTDPTIEKAQGMAETTEGIINGNADSTPVTELGVTPPSAAPTGQVALVTGAARGMGRSFANHLLSLGYKVCIADTMEDLGLQTCQQLAEHYGHDNVAFAKCDVTKDEDFQEAWTLCLEKLGPVTLLVNNAGVGDEKNWALTLNVNLGGCIRGTNLAMGKMDKSAGGEGGIVINIASIAGLQGHHLGPVYSATKHGIVGFTRSMGDHFHYNKTNVKVMCLCPSLVETEFLAASAKNATSEDAKQKLQFIDAKVPKLGLKEVDEGLIKLIQDGKNGSVLVVEKGKDMKYVESKL